MKFEKFSVPDGLPSNRICSIKQDKLGFVWIGTQGGLVRHDGYTYKVYQPDSTRSDYMMVYIEEDKNLNLWIATLGNGLFKYDRQSAQFIHFTHDPLDSTTISSNQINNTFFDSHDRLWLAHYDSLLDMLDVKTGKITRFRHNPSDSTSISCDRISNNGFIVKWLSLCEDSLGQVWIYTLNGLNRYNPETKDFTRFLYDPKVDADLIKRCSPHILADRQNNIWIATDSVGLIKYDQESNIFTRYQHTPDDPSSLWSNHCFHLFLDSQDHIWVSTQSSLESLNPQTGIFTHYENDYYQTDPKPIYECYPYFEDENGAIWYHAVESQAFGIIEPNTGAVHHLKRDANNPDAIGPLYLTAFCQDFSESMWFGSWWVGLNKLNRYKTQFSNFRHEANNPKSLHNNDARPFCQAKEDSTIIWIGGVGVSRFNVVTGEFTLLDVGPDVSEDQLKRRFHAGCQDSSGVFWTNYLGGGLCRIEGEKMTKFYPHDPDNPNGLYNPSFVSMATDTDGTIWIGTIGGVGIISFDPVTEKFKRYKYDPSDTTSAIGGRIEQLYFDHDHNLWICSSTGLSRYYPETESFRNYLKDDYIFDVFEDSVGQLWLGTGYNGVYLFDKKSGKIAKRYNTTNVLPFDTACLNFRQDDSGNLWFTAGAALAKYDVATQKFTFFYKEHGLPGTGFVNLAKLKSGKMILGVPGEGLVLFDPVRLKVNSIPPKMVLTDIKVFHESIKPGESVLHENITVAKQIELEHWQNDFSIEMTALHYGIPSQNKYAYFLENYDNDWLENGTSRIANYTNLDPGLYIFHAKGANADGFWNEEPVSLTIIINPPWWATIWAYMLYGFFIIGIAIITWNLQLRRIRLRNDLEMRKFETTKLKEVDRMKSRFFANISHEFRTPITLVLGPLERWRQLFNTIEAERDYSLMRRNILRLQRLINQLLDLSRLEAGNMDLQSSPHDILKLVNHFVQSFESQARLKGIDLTFSSSESTLMMMVDRDKMEHIVYNLMSNALKFTNNGGAVSVHVEKVNIASNNTGSNEWIEIRVSDTGIGIPQDRQERIFDRFYQVDDSFVREHEGSGIGLSLTKELVKLHGGEIFVESAPGVGSVFQVRLPLESAPDVQNEAEHSDSQEWSEEIPPLDQQSGAPSKDKPLILIVEDNTDLRFYMSEIIQSHYRFEQAEDGVDGFEKAQALVPDLIISDVMMPRMDGFQLCEKLKTDEITSHIPVILLTARATKENKLEGLETGADDYVIKPFDTDELLVRVKNLIDQRKRLRQKYSASQGFNIHKISVSSMDELFLSKAIETIEHELNNFNFNARDFAHLMSLSRSQLHRKLYHLTGYSATEFIRSIRLQQAASLIEQKSASISEIAYSVGFNHLSYFSKCFKNQYGVLPSDY